MINEAGKTKVWGRVEDPRERLMDDPPPLTVYLPPLLLLRALSRLVNINALEKEKRVYCLRLSNVFFIAYLCCIHTRISVGGRCTFY